MNHAGLVLAKPQESSVAPTTTAMFSQEMPAFPPSTMETVAQEIASVPSRSESSDMQCPQSTMDVISPTTPTPLIPTRLASSGSRSSNTQFEPPSPARQEPDSGATRDLEAGTEIGTRPELEKKTSFRRTGSWRRAASESWKRSGSWKATLELKESQTCWSHFLRWLDAYQVEERRPDKVGLIVTFVVMPLCVAYCVIFLYTSLHAPDPVTNELLWASGEGPFSMPVRCEVRTGCLLSNSYKHHPRQCEKLEYQEERIVLLEYSGLALDGPSVLAKANSTTTPIASVMSETHMPNMEAADSDGTYIQWTDILPGTSLMTYVHTLNHTARNEVGLDREEFFNLQVNTEADVIPGSTPCDPSGMQQARIRLHPAITRIHVEEGFSILEYIGTCSGQYAALLSWGAILVAVVDFYREYNPA